ncbi:hypothetical protein FBU30_008500 [Linnemannia zychae]|nr:hypothetical protein FBU30_008500 [Linnemannia zychae]
MLTSDNEDGDEESEIDDSGFSDRSDSEDDIDRLMSFDSEDEILSNSDYEDSDEETPLMKLVSRFDALHAWVSSSVTALSTLRDVASVSFILPSASITAASFWNVNRALVQTAQQQPQQQQLQLQQHQQQQSSRTPFKRVIARIRRRQAIRECRQRLAEIQPRDGLPVCLPLRTCGQWIQVINLQQEMPYHQRVMTQSFMQHPIPVRGRHDSTAHSRAIQLLQQQQQRQHGQREEGRFGAFRSVLQHLAEQIQGAQIAVTEPSEPERLLSRRDFVNDWTIKTIMDYCPGLCRLTLSECHGITDRSLELIRDSACVASQTLVSLHLAGCYQITDRGLLALAGNVKKPGDQNINEGNGDGGEIIEFEFGKSNISPSELQFFDSINSTDDDNNNKNDGSQDSEEESGTEDPLLHRYQQQAKEDSITDRALELLCESCPKLQLLDLSYISTITNSAMESLSETAKSLVCLTIIGCPGITSQSLLYLARLRNNSGKLGCITMGDALGISERDIEQIMQGTLSGWQKSLVDETNLGEILGRSWDE